MTAQGTDRVIEHRSALPHEGQLSSKGMSLREALAWCTLFAVITVSGIALSLHFTGTSSANAPADAKSANATEVGMRGNSQ